MSAYLPSHTMKPASPSSISGTASDSREAIMKHRTTNYALGHSPTEIRRLGIQAAILRPITMRLLQDLGVSPGMRILDIGSGAGDVALPAAEVAGESGAVVGIDRSEAAILAARARAGTARNVHSLTAAPEQSR